MNVPAQHHFTPGPWTAHEGMIWPRMFINGADGSAVAVTSFEQNSEANARLIAAAPDLLALAKQYASECAECGGQSVIPPCEDCADIRAVIVKAEGSQPDTGRTP